jgi:hypothetical protein
VTAGNRGWGCASYASLVGAIPALCRRRGRFAAGRPKCPARSARLASRRPWAVDGRTVALAAHLLRIASRLQARREPLEFRNAW